MDWRPCLSVGSIGEQTAGTEAYRYNAPAAKKTAESALPREGWVSLFSLSRSLNQQPKQQ